jgi:hypothetical protein
MINYCQSAQCRTRFILEYFGEDFEADWECGNCDACDGETAIVRRRVSVAQASPEVALIAFVAEADFEGLIGFPTRFIRTERPRRIIIRCAPYFPRQLRPAWLTGAVTAAIVFVVAYSCDASSCRDSERSRRARRIRSTT